MEQLILKTTLGTRARSSRVACMDSQRESHAIRDEVTGLLGKGEHWIFSAVTSGSLFPNKILIKKL